MDKCINCVVKMYYLSLIIVFLSMNMFMNIAYQYAYKLYSMLVQLFKHFCFVSSNIKQAQGSVIKVLF